MVKGKIKTFFCSNEFNNFFLLFTGIFLLTSTRTVNMTSAKESRKFMNLRVVNVKRAESEDKLVGFFGLIVTKGLLKSSLINDFICSWALWY